MELADTSAWTNRHKSASVEHDFETRVIADEIATCPIVVTELLWTAQTGPEFEELRLDLAALPELPINEPVWGRALEVWHELVKIHRHRQVKIAGLLVAAAAQIAGVPVCHYDADFDAIANVTGQQVRAIAPIGSL